MIVHRVREPDFPRGDVDAFIAWVEPHERDMRAAGLELGGGFDLVHSHDWLVAARRASSRARWKVPWLVTVHATEYGRHQGWVDKHPQSHIHGVERRMVRGADRVITCSAYMREHVADAFGIAPGRVTVIPNGIDPTDLQPSPTCRGCARSSRRRTRSSCCSSAGSSTRKASTWRSTRCPG